MSEILAEYVKDFHVFALTVLSMVLAFLSKQNKDKQDENK